MNSAIVLFSEATLALYPILIKKVDTNLVTQLVSRFLTYSVLAFVLASPKDRLLTWGTAKGITKSTGLGAITLLHVITSYIAFKELPTGISMSLFYTYPIWNLLVSVLAFGESITSSQIFLVFLSFIGVLLVSSSEEAKAETKEEGFDSSEKKSSVNWKGLLAGLAAAITESTMYFAVKSSEQPNPFFSMLQLYPAALPLLLLGMKAFNQPINIDLSASSWIPMLLFNTFIGFLGYSLRFFVIPKISTFLFSMLSFVGVLASFLWGYVFVKEIPSMTGVIGGAFIAAAAAFSNTKFL
jgi:drug/metabolite transporter (DMT)-like permease